MKIIAFIYLCRSPQSCPKTGFYGCSVRHTHIDKNIVYHKNRDNSPAQNEKNNSPWPILLVLTDRSCSRSKQAAKEEMIESSQLPKE